MSDPHRKPTQIATRTVTRTAGVDLHAELGAVRKLSGWLDAKFRIPGTSIRFGLDPVIGLIPGVGDLVTLAMSTYPILAARRLGLPKRTLVRMIANVSMDALIGAIPVLGDLYDFAFKANTRNLKLIERAIADRAVAPPTFDATVLKGPAASSS